MLPSPLADEAYEHARYLVEEIGPRGSTTPQEHQAAEYYSNRLHELGLDVKAQTFSSPKSAWTPMGLCMLLSLFSLLLSLLGELFVYFSLVLSLAAIYWALREVNLDDTLLNRLLSLGKSENRWAKILPREEKKASVVLLGHLDSHRTPLIMQSRFFSTIFTVFSILGYTSLVAVPIYLAGRVLSLWGNYLPFTPVIVIIQGILSALILQADFTRYSPGANDNAAAVGMVLACARYYKNQPLKNTEIILLASGCEEVGCYGMRRYLDQYRAEVKEARFIDYELIGRGLPTVTVREGLLFKQKCDEELAEISNNACRQTGIPMRRNESQVYGEGYVINKQGFAGITLTADPEGKPDVYWHTPRDTMDKLDKATLAMMFNWTKNILEEIDRAAHS